MKNQEGGHLAIDVAILKFLNITIASPLFDRLFVYVCEFHIWRWPLALIAVALLWRGGPRGRWMVALAVVAALVIDPTVYRVFKPLFGRLRPCHEVALEWVRAVAGCGGRYGFPSSHAANSLGLLVIAGAFYKTSRYYLIPIAVLVCIGRVYLGVHYPTDVLAGAVYGALVGIGTIYAAKKLAPDSMSKYLQPRTETGEK
jgi:undecaprenyl-diphosphatase